MKNSIVLFIFSVFNRNILFWEICFKKSKLLELKFRLIRICRSWRWFSVFSFLGLKYPFWVKLVQKFKNITLSWNVVPTHFWICKIRLWWSLFCFRPAFASFVQKINLTFWCHLINLSVIYSQRLEASGFSCFN